MEELIKILESIKPGYDYTKEENLIGDEIFTSFDIISIVAKISDQFNVQIPVCDIVPEKFNSAKSIYEIIKSLEDK